MKERFLGEHRAGEYQEFKEILLNKQMEFMKACGSDLTQEEIDFANDLVNKHMSAEYISKHDTVVPNTNIDIYEHIQKIQKDDIERYLVILLDENKKPITSKIVLEGTETGLPGHEIMAKAITEFLLSVPNAKYFIGAHNHPRTVGIVQSTGDQIQTWKNVMLGNMLGITMLDDCIVNLFGFYSYATDLRLNPKLDKFNKEKQSPFEFSIYYDKELKQLMKKDVILYSAIKKTLGDR